MYIGRSGMEITIKELKGMSPYALPIAVGLDLALGDPQWRFHPVRLHGALIFRLELVCRALPMPPRAQGAVFLVLNLLICAAIVSALIFIFPSGSVSRAAAEGLAIYFALGGTCLVREVSAVCRDLRANGLEAGKEGIRLLVSRDVSHMTHTDVISAAIETLAENFSDSACATLLCAAMGGPLLAWIHRASNTLDAMIGYRTEGYADFGWASARFDDVMNFIPARVSALLISLAAPSAGGSPGRSLRTALSDGGALESPNAGYPMAAFAGALGISICGPAYYFGELKDKPFIGSGPRPDERDVPGSIGLFWNSYALAFAVSLLIRWVVTS
jgi:adenosylcobinamide-phosphate synthase